jgi:hypothetical protein
MQLRDTNNWLMVLEDLAVFKYGRLTNAATCFLLIIHTKDILRFV